MEDVEDGNDDVDHKDSLNAHYEEHDDVFPLLVIRRVGPKMFMMMIQMMMMMMAKRIMMMMAKRMMMMAMMRRSMLLKVFPLPGYQKPGAQDDKREATQPLCRMKHDHYVASQVVIHNVTMMVM